MVYHHMITMSDNNSDKQLTISINKICDTCTITGAYISWDDE